MKHPLLWKLAAAVLLILPVASPAPEAVRPRGMFALYQENRERGIPNYITEDFLLLSHSMLMENALTTAEEKTFYPALRKLTAALRTKLAAGAQSDEAAASNLDFLAVLDALLSGAPDPAGARHADTASAELRQVRAAAGAGRSPLFMQNLDYTQFRVRGKYTRNETLGRYFVAYRYASAVLFPLLDSAATSVTAADADRLTRQALLLSHLLAADPAIAPLYRSLTGRFNFLFGPSEDLTVADYAKVSIPAADAVTAVRQNLFARSQRPAILSGLVDTSRLEAGRKPQDVLTGWRFLPQGALPDAAAMQELVFERVTDYRGQAQPVSLAVINGKPVKGFPLALEVMALLGSPAAAARLKESDEQNYAGYDDAWKKAQAAIQRPAGLASEHLELLRSWLESAPGKTGPGRQQARRLDTAVSFWTLQRYQSVLYAKQSYTAVSKGLPLARPREKSYLEPAPELYTRLQKLVDKARAQLRDASLDQFSQVLGRCIVISAMETKGAALTALDTRFLNDLDENLAGLIGRKDAPVVVDVHTEPNTGQVLEEGVGFAAEATKALAGDSTARGALFKHYEFKHPMQDRLTDEKFALMLAEGKL